MRRLVYGAVVAFGLALIGNAQQSAPSSEARFEVAAIKGCGSNESPREGAVSPGRLELACVTTINLIRLAYLIFPTGQANSPVSPSRFQIPITGGPSWIHSDRYQISAKAAQPVNVEMMKGPMMQALLEDRFKLKLHSEFRIVSVYELSMAEHGAKLTPARMGGCIVVDRNQPSRPADADRSGGIPCGVLRRNPRGGIDILGVTMPELCRRLSAYTDREIIDKTGINGSFDVHLDLSLADLASTGGPDAPSSAIAAGDGGPIASAVKELGLQMRLAKSTGESLVIDHVERPSEN